MKRTRTHSSDLERSVVAIGGRSVVEGELSVGRAERPDRNGLTIHFALTPGERDLHHGARTARENDAAGVRFAVSNGDATLAEAMWLVAIKLDQRRVIPVYGALASIVTTPSPPMGDHHRAGILRKRGLPAALPIAGGGVGAAVCTG